MPYHLLLQLLLHMNFGGNQTYSFTTKNCFAFTSNCQLARFNRVCHNNRFSAHEVEIIKSTFNLTPFSWLIETTDLVAAATLEQQGLVKYCDTIVGMRADITQCVPKEYDPSITIKKINSIQEQEEFLNIISHCYHYDRAELKKAIHNFLIKGQKSIVLYLGFYKHIPCAGALVIYHKDTITLHVIATLPEYRNKGLGTAITNQALSDGCHANISHALLLCSASIQPLYEKLGFQPFVQYFIYVYKK